MEGATGRNNFWGEPVNQPSSLENSALRFAESDFTKVSHEKRKVGRKRLFSPEEDVRLLELVKQHGEAKWSLIAEKMHGRNRKQLRDHYINYLKLRVSDKVFSPAEDDLIMKLVKEKGNAWNDFTKEMPGRSPITIKNRYYTKLKRELKSKTRLCKNM